MSRARGSEPARSPSLAVHLQCAHVRFKGPRSASVKWGEEPASQLQRSRDNARFCACVGLSAQNSLLSERSVSVSFC